MADVNTRLLDTIDLTGEQTVITTEAIKEVIIDVDDSDEESQTENDENALPVKRMKVTLKKCEICLEEQSKYTCPGCTMRTCSLDCVLTHKEKTGCSGQRNTTSFVARTDFNNIHLLNDYRLLEEATRIADNAHRDIKARRPFNEKKAEILQRHSRHAGVLLHRMERGMKRRKENMSRYIFVEKSIQWTVKLVFEDTEHRESREELHYDKEILEDIYAPFINKEKILPENKITFASYIEDGDEDEDGAETVTVFYRNEFPSGDNLRYTVVDHTATLKDILEGKSVLEYPVFHLALPKSVERLKDEQIVPGKESIDDKLTEDESLDPDDVCGTLYQPPISQVQPLDNWLATS